jgi:endonuclease-3 related protein
LRTIFLLEIAQNLNAAALRAFYDDLLAAYGPQRWWPVTDPDNARFEVLVGAVLTQHTAWTHAAAALADLRAAGPLTPQAILAHNDLPGLTLRAGTHRVKAARLRALCQWFVAAGGFIVLDEYPHATLRRELLAVPGIGPETADVIALYVFGHPCFVADAYAFRIFERYGWSAGTRRYERLRQVIEQSHPAANTAFYQELHALIVAHAKARCHKHTPDCAHCVLKKRCAHGRETI